MKIHVPNHLIIISMVVFLILNLIENIIHFSIEIYFEMFEFNQDSELDFLFVINNEHQKNNEKLFI